MRHRILRLKILRDWRSHHACFASGVIATALTSALCPWSVRTVCTVSMFQILSVVSCEAEMTCRSEIALTEFTPEICPLNVRSSIPVLRSHTLSVRSYEADTARWPFFRHVQYSSFQRLALSVVCWQVVFKATGGGAIITKLVPAHRIVAGGEVDSPHQCALTIGF